MPEGNSNIPGIRTQPVIATRSAKRGHYDAIAIGKMNVVLVTVLGNEIIKINVDRTTAADDPDGTQASCFPNAARNQDSVRGRRKAPL